MHGPAATVSGFVESLLKACPSLTELRLRGLGLRTLSEDSLCHMPALTRLDLIDNELCSIPSGLQNLAELEQLLVRRNPILFRSQDITVLAAVQKLKKIEVEVPRRNVSKFQASWNAEHDQSIERLTAVMPDLDVESCESTEDSEAED